MPRFNAANAREMAARSVALRRAAREERAAKAALLAEEAENSADYPAMRLTRVRKQLNRIDELLLSEDDPAKLDRLAAASMRLAEQERILAGRPLPGSLKPQAVRSRRQTQSFEPLDPPTQ